MIFDLIVIATYFVAVISIGLFQARRGQRTMEGFAIGNRQIPWWAVLGSILAAEISAATFLGAPGEGYALRNFTYAQLAIGTVLARIIIAFLFLKPYYDFRVVSIYEFLEVRFGVVTKNAASAVFLFTRALASGARLYVAAVILVVAYEMKMGSRPSLTTELWIYVISLVLITILTAVYTTFGGIKAVVWTDVIQASVMFGAIGFSIWTLLAHIPGGWSGVQSVLHAPKDLSFFDSGLTPALGWWGNIKSVLESEYTIWAALFGSTFLTMATHGTDQDMVQRMLTAKDHQRSRLALIVSGLADLPIVLCFLLIGILLWAFYQLHPDPKLGGNVFAHFILHEMPPGLRGLVVAGLFATAMGSLSTALNALATSFTRDWYLPYLNPTASERQTVAAARWSTVGFSILLILIGSGTAWAAIVFKSRVIPIVLGVFGYTYGSLLGVFLAGMLTKKRGSDWGNICAMICGCIFVSFLSGLHNDVFDLIHPDASAVRRTRAELREQTHVDPPTAAIAAKLQISEQEVELRMNLPAGNAPLFSPNWLPRIEFPWRVMFGTLLTLGIALLFPTPRERVTHARQRLLDQAKS